MYVCFASDVYMCAGGTCRLQRKGLDLLGLELQVVVNLLTWVLGTKLADRSGEHS